MVSFQSRTDVRRNRYGFLPHESQLSKLRLTSIGAKCGSTTIDRHLHAFMERKYGKAFKEKAGSLGIGSKFMRRFESIKRNFGGEPGEDFSLPLLMEHPDTDDYKQGFQRVTITRFGKHQNPGSLF